MSTELARANVIESVVIGGDLSKLTPEQRVEYYQAVCRSIGLNPLTKPFDYISLNGKLTLYARKDAADQLRSLNNISIETPTITYLDEWIVVTVAARDKTGRADSDIGVVNKKDMQGNFGNALMKAVTKAKRRVTLSICGLGWLDETEVETIPDARPVVVDEQTGEIVQPQLSEPVTQHEPLKTNGKANIYDAVVEAGLSENEHAAKSALGKCRTGYDTPEKAIAWMRLYRGWRDSGLNAEQSAAHANAGELPK